MATRGANTESSVTASARDIDGLQDQEFVRRPRPAPRGGQRCRPSQQDTRHQDATTEEDGAEQFGFDISEPGVNHADEPQNAIVATTMTCSSSNAVNPASGAA